MKKILLLAGAVIVALTNIFSTVSLTQTALNTNHLVSVADPGDMGG